jgi:hypothetical protein
VNGRPPVMKNCTSVVIEQESMNNINMLRVKIIFTSVQYSLPLFWKKIMKLNYL